MYSHLPKFFARFPEVELGEYKLCDLMLKYAPEYYEMMTDPEGIKYLSDEELPKSVEDAEKEIKYWGGLFYRKQSIFWAILDAKTGEFMGTVGYNNWNFFNGRAEISYDLRRKFWGKGIMTKIVRNVIIYSFQTMKLHRIEARTMQGNEASHKVLTKTGFQLEGVQRGYRLIRGQYEDINLYSVLRPDYASYLNQESEQ